MALPGFEAMNAELAALPAIERASYGVDKFGEGAVLVVSMQKTASVLVHFFHRLGLENEVVFVDTGYHFHETLALRDELMRRYRLNLVTVYPALTPEQQEAAHGCKLWRSVAGQPRCCEARKTVPFLDRMRRMGHRCAFGGLRRAEGDARANLDFVVADPRFDGVRINPLLDWTGQQVDAYLAEHGVPSHPLHARGYPSIGGCTAGSISVMVEVYDVHGGLWTGWVAYSSGRCIMGS